MLFLKQNMNKNSILVQFFQIWATVLRGVMGGTEQSKLKDNLAGVDS